MASKASDLLSRLPSANELLEKPPIRALADRWNRSVVAAGVRSFLDELRTDLERRATDVHLPSLRELAERAARHVAQLQQPMPRPAINATGRFFGPEWSGTPLAENALERIVALGSGFVLNADDASHGDEAALLCRRTGAEAATVISSYSGAVWLALAAISADKNIVVARGEVGELEADCSLPSIASAANVSLREVGTVNHVSAADYEAAISRTTAAILRNLPENYHVMGHTREVELEALVGLARDREVQLIELLGTAPLVNDLPGLITSTTSVAASIAAGAHLVVARGDGLVGGPRCGIIVGTRDLICRIESHPLFVAWHAAPVTRAALQATLSLYNDPQQLRQAIPLFDLMSTSIENLRQRAERLAPQFVQAEDVALAIAISTENCLGLARDQNQKMPSYAVALTPVDGALKRLEERLRSAPVTVLGRTVEGQLVLDLRTVLARQDQRLVEMVVSPAISTAENAATSAAISNP